MFIAIDHYGTGVCEPGYQRVGSDPGECVACVAGTFSESGLGACQPCPLSTTNNGTANVDCSFCPGGLTTFDVGSVSGECVEPVFTELTMIIVGSLLGLVAAVLLFVGVRRLVQQYRRGVAAALAQGRAKVERVQTALEHASSLSYSVCYVRLDDLRKAGKFVKHERLRDGGKLRYFDSVDEARAFCDKNTTIFCSHQWLDRTEPDPDNVHYNAVLRAAGAIARRRDLDDADVFLWIEYSFRGSNPRLATRAMLPAPWALGPALFCML